MRTIRLQRLQTMQACMIQRTYLLSALCAGLLCIAYPFQGHAFTAEGNLIWSVYGRGQLLKESRRVFTVTDTGGQWTLETRYVSGVNTGVVNNAFFDGQVLRTLLRFPRNRSTNDSVGMVFDTEVPRFDSTAFTPIWLAYCSGAYFKAHNGSRVPPVWEMPENSFLHENYPVVARCGFYTQKPFLPDLVVFWNKGSLWQELVTGNSSNASPVGISFYPAPKPFASGFTNAIYRVITATNIHEMVVPQKFELFRLAPNRHGSNQLETCWRIEGVLTQFLADEAVPSLPLNTVSNTIVLDTRIRTTYSDIPYARYFVRNGKWLSASNLASIPEVSKRVEANQRLRRARLFSAFGIFLALFVVPPAFALLLSRWRKKTETKQ